MSENNRSGGRAANPGPASGLAIALILAGACSVDTHGLWGGEPDAGSAVATIPDGSGLPDAGTYTEGEGIVMSRDGATAEAESGADAGCIEVRYRCIACDPTTTFIHFEVGLHNSCRAGAPIVGVSVRYWLSGAGTRETAILYYASVQEQVRAALASVDPRGSTDGYIEVTIDGAVDLAPDRTFVFQVGDYAKDFAPIKQGGDYSFDATATAQHASDRLTLYRNGVLIGGIEP